MVEMDGEMDGKEVVVVVRVEMGVRSQLRVAMASQAG